MCAFDKESSSRYFKVSWAGWAPHDQYSGQWQRYIADIQIRKVPKKASNIMGTCGADTAAAVKERADAHASSPCVVASTAAGCVTATHGPVLDHASAAVYKYTRSVVPERTVAPGVGLPCDIANVTFGDPIVARYLRIRAVDWVGEAPSMRVSLHGCEDAVPQATINGTKNQPGMPNSYTDPSQKTMNTEYGAAEAQIVTFEETLEMNDAMTADACQVMVASCNCNDETTKIGDYGLTYACDNAKCCMTKKGSSATDLDQTRFCNDESFCDNDKNYHVAVTDDGDANGWTTTAHGPSYVPNSETIREFVPASTTFETASYNTLHGPFGRGKGSIGHGCLHCADNMWVEKSFKLQPHEGITIVARIWMIASMDLHNHVSMSVDGTVRVTEAIQYGVNRLDHRRCVASDSTRVNKVSGMRTHAKCEVHCGTQYYILEEDFDCGCYATCREWPHAEWADGWHGVDKNFEDAGTKAHYYDAKYKDVSWTLDSHTAESATIRFSSNIDQDMADESWAFSELTILLGTNQCTDQFPLQRFSPGTGTMFTGASINHGTPLPMALSSDLGGNTWLVGVKDAAYLKMSKIKMTGASSYNWIATKYTASPTTACKVQASFNEACFVGTDSTSESYPLTLVATASCAYGYTPQIGDIPGFGTVEARGGGELVSNCDACGTLCNDRALCLSYECSGTLLKCSLNNARNPSGVQHLDYAFCSKQTDVSLTFLEEAASPARKMPSVTPPARGTLGLGSVNVFLEGKTSESRGVAPAVTKLAAAVPGSFLQVGSKTATTRYMYYGPGRRIIDSRSCPADLEHCNTHCVESTATKLHEVNDHARSTPAACAAHCKSKNDGYYSILEGGACKAKLDSLCGHTVRTGYSTSSVGALCQVPFCHSPCSKCMVDNSKVLVEAGCPSSVSYSKVNAYCQGSDAVRCRCYESCSKWDNAGAGPVYRTVEGEDYAGVKGICDNDSRCKGFSFASAGRMLDAKPSQDSGTSFLLFNRLLEADAEWTTEEGGAKYHMYVMAR